VLNYGLFKAFGALNLWTLLVPPPISIATIHFAAPMVPDFDPTTGLEAVLALFVGIWVLEILRRYIGRWL